jgi:hypothetical protein
LFVCRRGTGRPGEEFEQNSANGRHRVEKAS